MRLLLDEKYIAGHDLNANEACILAAILKCTRAGRGWYGNYRELAAAMPFVINHSTVYRAIQKLLNLGLIERREDKLFALLQNETGLLHDATELLQNETELLQSALPLNNPPINNNMNENQLSSPAQDARTEEKKTEGNLDFMDFWFLFSAPQEMLNRENACRRLWETFSRAKKQAIMKELTEHQINGTLTEERNPYYYLNNYEDPKPVFLRGDEPGDLVQVKYGDRIKICTRATMELFGLEWYADWNS
jgi:hypothetical protein